MTGRQILDCNIREVNELCWSGYGNPTEAAPAATGTASAATAGPSAAPAAGSSAGTASAAPAATAADYEDCEQHESAKPKKIKREKVRFGQAPRNALPSAPTDTATDVGAGSCSDSEGPGGHAAPGAVDGSDGEHDYVYGVVGS